MFREGRHAKKNKHCTEKMHCFFRWFFIDFSSKIHEKTRPKRKKQSCAKKSTKIHVCNALFLANKQFLIDFWGPSGSSGASRDVPGAIRFFIGLRLGVKTSLDLAPGGHTTSILSHMASILSHMASVLSHMFSIFSHIISILSPMGGIASMLC